MIKVDILLLFPHLKSKIAEKFKLSFVNALKTETKIETIKLFLFQILPLGRD